MNSLDINTYIDTVGTVYLGDCRKKLKLIADESISCCITDPPYFINGLGNDWKPEQLDKKKSKANVVGGLPIGMKFDPKQGIELQAFMEEVSKEIYRVLKPGGFYLTFSQPRLYHRLSIAVENCGFEIRDMLIWKREGQGKAFSQEHFVKKMDLSDEEKALIIAKLDNRKTPQLRGLFEPICLAQKPKDGTFVINWINHQVGLINNEGNPTTIFDVPKEHSKIPHLTVKHVALIEQLINIFTDETATILDPFLGSGTTAIACYNTKRRFIGIEQNPEYYELALNRMKDIRK